MNSSFLRIGFLFVKLDLKGVQAGEHECNAVSVDVIYNSHVFERPVE